jgi:dCTP deaminase
MGVLTRDTILDEIEEGNITIEPLEREQIGPASIDLTLDSQFRIYQETDEAFPVTEEADPDSITEVIDVEDSLVLRPGEAVHGITVERIDLPSNTCGWIEGRSRFARLGLSVHVTASFVQPGVSNRTVLEMNNMSPVPLELRPGTRICQLILERTEGEAAYRGRYTDQDSV